MAEQETGRDLTRHITEIDTSGVSTAVNIARNRQNTTPEHALTTRAVIKRAPEKIATDFGALQNVIDDFTDSLISTHNQNKAKEEARNYAVQVAQAKKEEQVRLFDHIQKIDTDLSLTQRQKAVAYADLTHFFGVDLVASVTRDYKAQKNFTKDSSHFQATLNALPKEDQNYYALRQFRGEDENVLISEMNGKIETNQQYSRLESAVRNNSISESVYAMQVKQKFTRDSDIFMRETVNPLVDAFTDTIQQNGGTINLKELEQRKLDMIDHYIRNVAPQSQKANSLIQADIDSFKNRIEQKTDYLIEYAKLQKEKKNALTIEDTENLEIQDKNLRAKMSLEETRAALINTGGDYALASIARRDPVAAVTSVAALKELIKSNLIHPSDEALVKQQMAIAYKENTGNLDSLVSDLRDNPEAVGTKQAAAEFLNVQVPRIIMLLSGNKNVNYSLAQGIVPVYSTQSINAFFTEYRKLIGEEAYQKYLNNPNNKKMLNSLNSIYAEQLNIFPRRVSTNKPQVIKGTN